MSLRSISGLPTCLRGRLARRQPAKSAPDPTSILHASTIHQPRPLDSTQTRIFTDIDGYVTSRENNALGGDSRPQKARLDGHTRRKRLENVSHSTKRRFRTNTNVSNQDVVIALPGSIGGRVHRDFSISDLVSVPTGWGATTDDWGAWWASLHDKFLEVRKTTPEKMSGVFQKHTAFANEMVNSSSYDEVSGRELRRRWCTLLPVMRAQLLPALVIGSLVQSAAQCLFVLRHVPIHQAFRIRMNCLRHIGIMYRKDLENDTDLRNSYEKLIEEHRSPKSWPEEGLPGVLLNTLLRWSSPEQCEAIINDFQKRYPNAKEACLTFIIDHYLGRGDARSAFKYFQYLSEDALQKPDAKVKTLRDRLLKLDVVVKSENGTNFQFLPQLLTLGMPSDESLHNTVIESAIRNGMPGVAWDVYEYLEQSEFSTSARSYLVLLRDAFQRGDLQRVNTIMTAIHGREDLTNDQYLLAYSMNIVRVICCYERKLKPHEAQAHIIALYDRVYNRSPLVTLKLAQARSDEGGLPQPTPTLLAFTVWTHILTQPHADMNARLWAWVKHLIASGNEIITEAASHDIIYNGLILFHARKAESLMKCLEVVQYMLSNKLCLPTSRTWSILLCAFLKHGQVDQAQHVLQMMQEKGFRIEEVYGPYREYLPQGVTLEGLTDLASHTLDERQMPPGLEELMSCSRSLQGETALMYSARQEQ